MAVSPLAVTHPTNARRVSSRTLTVILCLSGTVASLQHTLIVPLITDLPAILGVGYGDATWLITVSLLVSAVATPIISRLADMVGKKRMMLAALGAMVTGSLIAAIGASFVAVLIGRGLQGMATALIPVAIAVLRDELPREKIAGATATMSATFGIGSAFGLPLSGIVYRFLGWESVFWFSAAAGLALLVAVLVFVPESPIRTPGRFDYRGAILLSAALTSLLLVVSKGGTWGWTGVPTLIAAAISVASFAIWFPLQLRTSEPMVDLRSSARRPVLLTNLVALLAGFAVYGNMIVTTQQLVMTPDSGYGHGMSVFVAGLCMMPSSLTMVAFAPVTPRVMARIGAKRTLMTGAIILVLAYVSRIFLTGSVPMIILGSMLVTIGTAITYATMPLIIMRSSPITQSAAANGVNTLLRSIGTSMAGAVIAGLLASVTVTVAGRDLPSLAAFQIIFGMSAVAGLVATVVAAFIPRLASPTAVTATAVAGADEVAVNVDGTVSVTQR